MKRCRTAASVLRPGAQFRRWASYDKASLTREELLRQVQADLDKSIRVDAEAKTISTSAGDLPISPVFDPAWIQSRRRQRKPDAGKPTGRFRRKLRLNPYARALATPIRTCAFTDTALPRYFLQDIEIVSHPTTGKPWYAPGPLAFDRVRPIHYPTEGGEHTGMRNEGGKSTEGLEEGGDMSSSTERARPHRAPLTAYTLNRKDMLDRLGPGSKLLGQLFGPRNGTAWSPELRRAVWRADMGDTILGMMRRLVVDALVDRATGADLTKFVEPVEGGWDAVGKVDRRQSVLWIPSQQQEGGTGEKVLRYPTVDVPGAKYNGKMAVYNLSSLLGEEEIVRLRASAPEVFCEGKELFVLKSWGSQSMVNLHLLLWRLEGYLAPTPPLGNATKKDSDRER
ncbi:Thioesterase domain [Geosmithia morbida]|uniref:Thioesterase domain n=1 Tax=Geosmithia morbida TaxID=1094350 RepID=A0A9P4YUF3_9HYPO|nr:Thioesterase domain [Geosmithia morbida]KAF4121888.1 Thioesterase domain [Geosmithia morbida]